MVEKLEENEIKTIKDMYQKGKTIDEIEEATGRSRGVIHKYAEEAKKEKKLPADETPSMPQTQPQIKPTIQPQQAQPIQTTTLRPAKPVMPPFPEIPEPQDWLREFLANYRLKEPFVIALCNRVIRRQELPHPSDLMADIQQMDSGQNNTRQIAYIVEDYEFELNKYLATKQNIENMPLRRRQGIPVGGQQQPLSTYPSQGIRTYDRQRQRYPYYEDDPYDYPEDRRRGIPIQPTNPTYSYPPTPHGYPYPGRPYENLESELERLAAIQRLLGKSEEKNPAVERYERDNQELKQKIEKLEDQRQQDIMGELQQLRQSYQIENQRRRELEEELRGMEFKQAQKGLSETDLKYKELEDRQALELRKLEEGGKTRETIANAVKTGFSSIGQAIFRTAQEMGSEEQKPMPGYTDNRNMWQANCPFCGELITAPVSAKQVLCPGCNRELELNDQQTQQEIKLQQPTPRQRTPIIQPEQEPPQTELTIANCYYCKKPISIPPGAKLVECPYCNRRLEVTTENGEHETTPTEEIKKYGDLTAYKTSYDIPVEPELEPEQIQQTTIDLEPEIETKIEETPKKETPPSWKEQLKPSKKPKVEEPEETKKQEPEEKATQPTKFICDEPGCSKGFDTENQLRGHKLHHARMKKKIQQKEK